MIEFVRRLFQVPLRGAQSRSEAGVVGGAGATTPAPLSEVEWVQRVARIVERESRDWVTRSGSTFHKIHWPQAVEIARILLAEARKYGLNLAYFLAVLCQESRFDPKVINPNRKRNPEGLVERMDYGIGQVSGRNLLAEGAGVDPQVMVELALDPRWGAHRAASVYRGLLNWVKIKSTKGAPGFTGSDPLYVATMAYNRGKTGTEIILSGVPRPGVRGYETEEEVAEQTKVGRKHADSVMKFYTKFAEELKR